MGWKLGCCLLLPLVLAACSHSNFDPPERSGPIGLVDASSQARYYPGIGGGSSDKAMIGKLRAFADAHIPASARNATETSIANIEYRLKVKQERMPAIEAWLKQQGK